MRKPPANIRVYLVEKNGHFFINDGVLEKGFDHKLTIDKTRDDVLSAFSKMGFLFDEFIRLRIIGHSNDQDNKELLYLLNLVPVNRKIRAFLDWGVFEPEFTRNLSRLFEVRNDVVHSVSLDEVIYNHPKKKILFSSKSGFKKFTSDFDNAWNHLLKLYQKQQQKINWDEILNPTS